MPTLHLFDEGRKGFVLHRINPHGTVMRYSAWFDAEGGLLDAEGRDVNGRSRAVRRDTRVWAELATVGARYAQMVKDGLASPGKTV